MGRRTKAQKEATQAPQRQVIVMSCEIQLGTSEGEGGKTIVMDYMTANHGGYITIKPEQGVKLVMDLCTLLGIPMANTEAPPMDPGARLVAPDGATLVK